MVASRGLWVRVWEAGLGIPGVWGLGLRLMEMDEERTSVRI